MPNREIDPLHRASDPNTKVSDLVALLTDFPGNVLRNPAFEVAISTDMSILRGLDLPRQAILAIDAEYRKLGLTVAPAGFKEVAKFCDRRCGKPFRFTPSTRVQTIDYAPMLPVTSKVPPQELVTALRFASALMPGLTRIPDKEQLDICARFPADLPYKIDGFVRSDSRSDDVSLPDQICDIFRNLLINYAGFSLEVRRGGLEADLTTRERAFDIEMRLVKAVGKANVGRCFEVDGRPADCSNPEGLLDAIRSLERTVPRRDRDEIVWVIDDRDGFELDVGITAMSVPAEDVLADLSQGELRKAIATSLEELSEQFRLEDAERIDVDEFAVSRALDRIHELADSVFQHNSEWSEFQSRIAAFRSGKLIAFFGDKWEVEKNIGRARLRSS
jgi:hypothetical protein